MRGTNPHLSGYALLRARMTKPFASLTLVLAVLLGAGGVAFGQAGFFGGTPQPDQTGKAPAAAPSDSLKERFGIFRRPRAAGDGSAANDPTAQAAGADPAQSRRAFTTTSGDHVLLAPGRDSLCLGTSRTGNLACGSARTAVAGGIVVSIVCGGIPADAIHVYGAVPDGISEVTVLRANGSDEELPVTGNAYALETKKSDPLPTSITWDTPQGPMTVPTTVPGDAASSRCVKPDTTVPRTRHGR